MGKTTKWWRSLLGFKKPPPESSSSSAAAPSKEKKKTKWAISKPADNKFNINEDFLGRPCGEGVDANKHAIAVAAATAAVAEAALAAAQAAAEVVRLTSGGGSGRNYVPAYIRSDRRRVAAAVKIQSAFRAYLARRALRALKGLVKLQALVRGHIVRKQSSDMLRRMQAMARIQARASAHRSYVSENSNTNIKFSNSRHPQHNTKPRVINSNNNWFNQWMEQSAWNDTRHDTSPEIDRLDDERSDKILEIDTWKPRQTIRGNEKFNFSHHFPQRTDTASRLPRKNHKSNPSVSSEEMSSIRSPNFPSEWPGWAADISPTVRSTLAGTNRGVPFTPTRSECSRSFYGDYIGSNSNYMANTESSRAKIRSQSAPKQRMRLEMMSGISNHKLWEPEAHSEKGYNYLNSVRGAPRGLGSSYGYRL